MPRARSIVPVLGVAVLVVGALLIVGCDEHAVESGGAQEVVFDLRPLFRTDAGEPCVSVVDSLVLTVTESDGTEQTAIRLLTPDEAEVRIPVAVDPGAVTFEAEVRSNNGTRLYTGSVSADVEAEGFRVEVPLTAVNAVLKACPDLVPLDRFDTAYRGELRVINRGSRAVTWEAAFDAPLCGTAPCFDLDPSAAPVDAGDTVRVVGAARTTTLADAFDVQIASEVGTLDVRFVIETLGPVVRPDTVAVLEGGFVAVEVLANDVDPEGDPLTLFTVGAALYGATEQDADLAFYTANYTPVWGETSEDGFTYVADAGGRRAEGAVTVRVDPCIVFEEMVSSEAADVPLVTENSVTAHTRLFQFGAGTEDYVFADVDLLPQSNDDLGVYLENAALAFDWPQQPVRYVRVDFLDGAATVNFAVNNEDPFIGPALTPTMPVPPGVTLRIEDGKFGAGTRLVLEADAATPIDHLLLGGGDEDRDDDILLLDDICFGLAPPSDP